MAKSYSQMQKQIAKLQREAEALKKKEVGGVVERIKDGHRALRADRRKIFSADGLQAVDPEQGKPEGIDSHHVVRPRRARRFRSSTATRTATRGHHEEVSRGGSSRRWRAGGRSRTSSSNRTKGGRAGAPHDSPPSRTAVGTRHRAHRWLLDADGAARPGPGPGGRRRTPRRRRPRAAHALQAARSEPERRHR